MDAGIMLNMLNGNAAASTPAAAVARGGNSQGANMPAPSDSTAASSEFPTMVNQTSEAVTSSTTSQSGTLQSLSISGKSQGVMQPEGAENILVQGTLLVDSVKVGEIVSQNKILANKLDGLIATGDIEGFASIMQNIKAIVEQINTGEFDLSNLDALLGQNAPVMASMPNLHTPPATTKSPSNAAEHSLSSVQAAARFQPIVNVPLDPVTNAQAPKLPVDILTELAELGRPSSPGATVNGQAINTATSLDQATSLTQATSLAQATSPTQATSLAHNISTAAQATGSIQQTANPVAASSALGSTVQAQPTATGNAVNNGMPTPASVGDITPQEIASANKSLHNPLVNNTLGKESEGLTIAAHATIKVAGTAAIAATPAQMQNEQIKPEGAVLPQQAAAQAAMKPQAQPAPQAHSNQGAQSGHANSEAASQSSSTNNGGGQSAGNSGSGQSESGQSQTNSNGNGAQGQANSNTQHQAMQDKSHIQSEIKPASAQATPSASAHVAQTATMPTAIQAAMPEQAPTNPQVLTPELTTEQSVNTANLSPSQASIAPKNFGGTITQGLTKDVAAQVGMEVSRAVKQGNTEFTVKLNPIELGKVTIKMAFDKDGATSLKILAQSTETLELLRRDMRGLERAMEAGGIKSEQSNISIELDNQHNGQSAGKTLTEAARDELAQENRDKSSALKANETAEEAQIDDITPLEQILAQLDSASGLDIRV